MDLIRLVSAGAKAALGRFTHVIASGFQGTSGWTENALEKFEHSDCGCVAPVVRDSDSGRIIAAGWQDSSSRLCKPGSGGRDRVKQPSVLSPGKSMGAFLQASFWRTELLSSLDDAFVASDVIEASATYEYLARDVVGEQSLPRNLSCCVMTHSR